MSKFERLPFDGLPIGKPPPASPPSTRNRKLIIGAAIIEGTVISAGTLSAVTFALRFSHDSVDMMQALAPQLAFIAVELSRIPLAIQCRVNPSRFTRVLAVVGLVGGAGITTKTMIQAVDAMYEPRFSMVRHADAALEDAKENQAAFNATYQAATEEVERDKSLVDSNSARARDGSADLRNLPRVCDAKHRCHADSRSKLIGGNLSDASQAGAAARKDLNAASLRLRALDPSKPSQAVRAAELAKRDALGASPFHLLAAQLTGKPVTQIRESAMSSIMRFFILGASILTALTASIMAMCAVTPIKAEKPNGEETTEVSGEALLEIGRALSETAKTLHDPEDVALDDFAAPEHPAPAKVETPADNTKARPPRQNAAVDGRSRAAKEAKRKAREAAENVLKFRANKESS
jgi:hypothetical protein